MKIPQTISVRLLSLSLGLTATIFGCTTHPEPEVNKPTEKTVAPTSDEPVQKPVPTYTLTGEIAASTPTKAHFNIPGSLEAGEISWSTGTTFRKNQLLFQLNNAAAFRALNVQKQELAQRMQAQLPEIRKNFPAETPKWEAYVRALGPENLVPAFPSAFSLEEQDFLRLQDIPAQHVALQQLQDDMRQYFYLAPFDGSFSEISIVPGQSIEKGRTVALLSPKGKYLLTARFAAENINALKQNSTIDFHNAQGKIVASGKLNKISKDPTDPQLHSARYLITPKNGARLQLGEILQTTVTVN
jgi:multidrug efflux pump subunit AcrA (membrane-fusion protein)